MSINIFSHDLFYVSSFFNSRNWRENYKIYLFLPLDGIEGISHLVISSSLIHPSILFNSPIPILKLNWIQNKNYDDQQRLRFKRIDIYVNQTKNIMIMFIIRIPHHTLLLFMKKKTYTRKTHHNKKEDMSQDKIYKIVLIEDRSTKP